MKKKKFETVEKYVNVTDEEIVNDFMVCEFVPEEWNEDDFTYYDDFWEDYDLTEEDTERIWSLIKTAAYNKIEEFKDKERNQLSNREKIIYFLNELKEEYPYIGTIGYLLSTEEILDLIIENGKK